MGCSPWGHEESDTTEQLHFHFSLSCIGEGNGNSLQCSCLENPREGGAWWAAVYGVAQSQTRLMRLSSSSSIIRFVVNSGRTISNFMKPPASGPHTRTRATEREPVAARNLSGRHERHEGAAEPGTARDSFLPSNSHR